MESFGIIAELSKNESIGTPNNEVFYSSSKVPAFKLKNYLKII